MLMEQIGLLENGHLDILKWLAERNILPDTNGANDTSENGRIDVLKWLAKKSILPDLDGSNL